METGYNSGLVKGLILSTLETLKAEADGDYSALESVRVEMVDAYVFRLYPGYGNDYATIWGHEVTAQNVRELILVRVIDHLVSLGEMVERDVTKLAQLRRRNDD